MFPLPNGETVIRLRRQLIRDPYSDEETLGSWEGADEMVIRGVAIAPTSSVEPDADGRQLVVTGVALYCAADEDIQPEDRIRARSGLWDAKGELLTWRSPFTGWEPGAQVSIEKVKG